MDDVIAASKRIEGHGHRTAILTNQTIDDLTGKKVFFKCENFQKIGAFKFRGGWNAISSLSENDAVKGVCTHSSGNHAQAVAYAAKKRTESTGHHLAIISHQPPGLPVTTTVFIPLFATFSKQLYVEDLRRSLLTKVPSKSNIKILTFSRSLLLSSNKSFINLPKKPNFKYASASYKLLKGKHAITIRSSQKQNW